MAVEDYEAPKPKKPVGVSRDGAKGKVEKLEVSSRAPDNLARLVIEHMFSDDRGHPAIVGFKDDLYGYEDGCWRRLEENQVKAKISRFLDHDVKLKEDKDTVARTSWHTRETYEALVAQVLLPADTNPPCWIGKGAPPWGDAQVATFANCILDLISGERHASTPAWFEPSAIHVNYNPKAKAPHFDTFLNSQWTDDPASKDALGEMMGETFFGRNRRQKIFAIKGPPRSGKGTLFKILMAVLKRAAIELTFHAVCMNFVQAIIGRRAVIVPDLEVSKKDDLQIGMERIKSYSGGDPTNISRKGTVDDESERNMQWWLGFNQIPELVMTDASGAFPSRIFMLVMSTSYLGREDINLEDKLLGELEGIVLIAVRGWQRLEARGKFELPESARSEHERLTRTNTVLSEFTTESLRLDTQAVSEKLATYDAYKAWCERRGIKKVFSENRFFNRLYSIPGVREFRTFDDGTAAPFMRDGKKPEYPKRRIQGFHIRNHAEPRRVRISNGMSNIVETVHCPECKSELKERDGCCWRCRELIPGDEIE